MANISLQSLGRIQWSIAINCAAWGCHCEPCRIAGQCQIQSAISKTGSIVVGLTHTQNLAQWSWLPCGIKGLQYQD